MSDYSDALQKLLTAGHSYESDAVRQLQALHGGTSRTVQTSRNAVVTRVSKMGNSYDKQAAFHQAKMDADPEYATWIESLGDDHPV